MQPSLVLPPLEVLLGGTPRTRGGVINRGMSRLITGVVGKRGPTGVSLAAL